ncbi:MAG: ROK family protein [Chloroflexi bacterium]|jgi:fructokinase|nr:ROK family protein [Chloroflexota bacterium]
MALYGGIEAGGTKFVCAVASEPGEIREEIRFPTAAPAEALAQAVAFFRSHAEREPLLAVGVSCFGPVDPNPASPTFGYVTTTPKPHWAHTDVVGQLRAALQVPVGFDTDVNGAALGEHRWGAARGLDTFVYLTIGTGLGGGGMVNGRLLHGLMHAEMGHMRIPHDRSRDPYPGWCTYHGDCWEGLACGPAIEERWQQKGMSLGPEHPAWELEAHYLALGVTNIILTLSPQRIILGGGVMDQQQLFPLVRREVRQLLNGYVQKAEVGEAIDTYLVPPQLGNRAGVLGSIALAMDAAL